MKTLLGALLLSLSIAMAAEYDNEKILEDIRILQDHPNFNNRAKAAERLRKAGKNDQEACSALIQASKKDSTALVRSQSILSLGQMGVSDFPFMAVTWIQKDSSPAVRKTAADGLLKLVEHPDVMRDLDLGEYLTQFLRDKNQTLRQTATQVLKKIGLTERDLLASREKRLEQIQEVIRSQASDSEKQLLDERKGGTIPVAVGSFGRYFRIDKEGNVSRSSLSKGDTGDVMLSAEIDKIIDKEYNASQSYSVNRTITRRGVALSESATSEGISPLTRAGLRSKYAESLSNIDKANGGFRNARALRRNTGDLELRFDYVLEKWPGFRSAPAIFTLRLRALDETGTPMHTVHQGFCTVKAQRLKDLNPSVLKLIEDANNKFTFHSFFSGDMKEKVKYVEMGFVMDKEFDQIPQRDARQ